MKYTYGAVLIFFHIHLCIYGDAKQIEIPPQKNDETSIPNYIHIHERIAHDCSLIKAIIEKNQEKITTYDIERKQLQDDQSKIATLEKELHKKEKDLEKAIDDQMYRDYPYVEESIRQRIKNIETTLGAAKQSTLLQSVGEKIQHHQKNIAELTTIADIFEQKKKDIDTYKNTLAHHNLSWLTTHKLTKKQAIKNYNDTVAVYKDCIRNDGSACDHRSPHFAHYFDIALSHTLELFNAGSIEKQKYLTHQKTDTYTSTHHVPSEKISQTPSVPHHQTFTHDKQTQSTDRFLNFLVYVGGGY